MAQELVSHMRKEDAIWFPAMKSGGHAFVNQPIAAMRSEHLDHVAQLNRLLELTNDATPLDGHQQKINL